MLLLDCTVVLMWLLLYTADCKVGCVMGRLSMYRRNAESLVGVSYILLCQLS